MPTSNPGMQAVFEQPATPKQSGSAQSTRPSPSSSMPLLHSSIWWFENADSVTVTGPACAWLSALTITM